MKTLGLIILIIGLVMTLFTGIKIVNHRKVAEVGPIEITKEETTPVYFSPWSGVMLMAVGGSILIFGGKRTNVLKSPD